MGEEKNVLKNVSVFVAQRAQGIVAYVLAVNGNLTRRHVVDAGKAF